MKPALTPEKWAEVLSSEYPAPDHINGHPDDDPHRMAALCLYGQPFGFWSELPKTLRIAAQKLRVLTGRFDDWGDLETAADRIEALLPPEEP